MQSKRLPIRTKLAAMAIAVFSPLGLATPAHAGAMVILSGSSWFQGGGVNVCADSTDPTCGGEAHVGGWSANWWQCVELAQRFYQKRGWHSGIFANVDYAYQIYTNASSLGMKAVANGGITKLRVGDMIIHSSSLAGSGGAGHVAIVDSINGSTVGAVEQNFSSTGRATYTYSNNTLSRAGTGNTILGIVHDPDNMGTKPDEEVVTPPDPRSAITAGKNADGRVEIYGVGTDRKVYAKSQISAGSGYEANWAVVQASAKDVAMAENTDGTLSLFYIGGDYALWHRRQVVPNGGFSAEERLGGNIRAISATRNADGRVEVYAIGTDKNIYALAQETAGGTFEVHWTKIPAYAKDVATTVGHDGRIVLAYVGGDNAVWWRRQTAPNGGFSSESKLNANLRPYLALGTNADGRVEVFGVGTDKKIYARAQTSAGAGFEANWAVIPAQANDLSVTMGGDGRLTLAYVGTDYSAWERHQIVPNGGYSAEVDLDGVFE